MSETSLSTDRRSFLKTGALMAAPLAAAAAPIAALAADDSRKRLARLEDERAIEVLHRRFLRHVNGGGGGELFASAHAPQLCEGLRALAEDMHHEAALELSEDGLSATLRCTCRVEREVAFTGDTTIERMMRFQGQGSHRHEEKRVLATEFVKGQQGWSIAGARFA